MGRKIKRGLDYYPVDVDIASDIKMRKLLKRCGGQAYTVYAFLLCLIYKNGYYIELDEDLPFILSEQTGYSEEYINQVIDCCLDIDLFNKTLYASDKVITSRAIQERYSLIRRLTNVKNPIDEFSLISSQETPISCQEMPISSQETPSQNAFPPIYSENSAQSKVKESKVKENKYNLPQEDINYNNSNTHARGGGNFKNLYQELSKHAQIPEDVWEAVAITGSFQNHWTSHYQQWLSEAEDTRRPLNELNQYLRKYCGDVNIDYYYAMGWCKDNLMQDQYAKIYEIVISKPQALTELRKCIKEIKKGGINQPGLFIFSKLNKL